LSNIKKKSRKRELKGAEEIEGKAHPGSGNVWYKKGDFSNEFIFVEDKFTTKNTYTLTCKTLEKVERQAKEDLKIPVLKIGFTNHKQEYAIIRDIYIGKDFEFSAGMGLFTEYRSIILEADSLPLMFIRNFSKDNKLIIAILKFNWGKNGQCTYYIIEWQSFIDVIASIFK